MALQFLKALKINSILLLQCFICLGISIFIIFLQMNITNLLTCALLWNECLKGILTIPWRILPTIKILNFAVFKTFVYVFYKATTDSSWPPADNITTFASIYWSLAETGSTHKPFEKIYVLHDSNLSINAHALFFKCDCSIYNKTSVKKGSQIQQLIVYKSSR